ncbi:MAG: hypothetical protein HC906_18330 [Bacteroidales bacterium]|nr:hypothetical protein [Bacteroidales bacterium]
MVGFLREVVSLLDNGKLPYLISGSLAYNFYAVPRATRDIDVIIEMGEKDIDFFIFNLKNKYYFNKSAIEDAVHRKNMFNIIHFESGYKLDIILLSDDLFEKNKFSRKVKIQYENDLFLWIITAEDLIISKLRWIQQLESNLHKNDIKQLLLYPGLNMDYIYKWCKTLNLNTYNLLNL